MIRLRANREPIAAALAALYILVVTTMMPAPVVLLSAFGVDITGAGLCGSLACESAVAEADEPTLLEQLWGGACGGAPIETTAGPTDDSTSRERPDTCPYSTLRVIAVMCALAIDTPSETVLDTPQLCDRVQPLVCTIESRAFDVPSPPPKA